ncbi:MAG: hypothetical protein UR28_C0003G0049 [Candidatus Peregrinibacteria bacterium GW2011_GWF2_33_10]|nr:MAG: hypothetical protein UR28_C0003G0049 [Candidatus Peregrinibacteria bacterium GW2011_GWF2_33_10]OGJ44200.1 MAG: hypothetical protein A2263_04465 [Candidatus Peregrinibacteria bacterium RIFOXYA2_FULL_33_21]OGJ46684.1 MAG: hypothetical protein A2272_04725 [Candidatus Peregrinibacteria bacterium RIFOXYA12_FULL_33_12]OGJ51829.1 MAG: hypothetical protein A2307_05130 [Candidatus Peregrinibacteria bacterium RIFOXYB2_FULL_33_20]
MLFSKLQATASVNFNKLFDLGTLELIGIALLAVIPVMLWIPIFHYKNNKSKKIIIFIFLLGTLTVLPIIGLQYLWVYYPQFDIYAHINSSVTNVHLGFLLTFIFVGIFEEIAKHSVVHYVDHSKIQVETINDAILFGILAALGFSFTENIFYLNSIIKSGNFINLMAVFSFRSIVTMCAHMVFSGIMGYYYGMAKFADPFYSEAGWRGKKFVIADFLYRLIKFKKIHSYRISTMMKGLFIAMSLHAAFNFFLQFQMLWQAVILIFGGYLYIHHIMRRKAVHVLLGVKNQRPSLMAKKDEEVVIELLGMWMNEGKHKEVKEICDRLLQRDPDNPIIKLFKAKAEDSHELNKAYIAIHNLFTENDIQEQKSIFEKPLTQEIIEKSIKPVISN